MALHQLDVLCRVRPRFFAGTFNFKRDVVVDVDVFAYGRIHLADVKKHVAELFGFDEAVAFFFEENFNDSCGWVEHMKNI